MAKKNIEEKMGFLRSHPALYMWILLLAAFGTFCLSNYCNAVYIGYGAFLCKIIGMMISQAVISWFFWSVLHNWDKKKSGSLCKSHPRLFQYGCVFCKLLIVAVFLFLSVRLVYPVMADVIHGPEAVVVTYVRTDSEERKVGRRSGRYTLYHLYFKDENGRLITINLTNREFDAYREYFESLDHQELIFYPHTHVSIVPEKR